MGPSWSELDSKDIDSLGQLGLRRTDIQNTFSRFHVGQRVRAQDTRGSTGLKRVSVALRAGLSLAWLVGILYLFYDSYPSDSEPHEANSSHIASPLRFQGVHILASVLSDLELLVSTSHPFLRDHNNETYPHLDIRNSGVQ